MISVDHIDMRMPQGIGKGKTETDAIPVWCLWYACVSTHESRFNSSLKGKFTDGHMNGLMDGYMNCQLDGLTN